MRKLLIPVLTLVTFAVPALPGSAGTEQTSTKKRETKGKSAKRIGGGAAAGAVGGALIGGGKGAAIGAGAGGGAGAVYDHHKKSEAKKNK